MIAIIFYAVKEPYMLLELKHNAKEPLDLESFRDIRLKEIQTRHGHQKLTS